MGGFPSSWGRIGGVGRSSVGTARAWMTPERPSSSAAISSRRLVRTAASVRASSRTLRALVRSSSASARAAARCCGGLLAGRAAARPARSLVADDLVGHLLAEQPRRRLGLVLAALRALVDEADLVLGAGDHGARGLLGLVADPGRSASAGGDQARRPRRWSSCASALGLGQSARTDRSVTRCTTAWSRRRASARCQPPSWRAGRADAARPPARRWPAATASSAGSRRSAPRRPGSPGPPRPGPRGAPPRTLVRVAADLLGVGEHGVRVGVGVLAERFRPPGPPRRGRAAACSSAEMRSSSAARTVSSCCWRIATVAMVRSRCISAAAGASRAVGGGRRLEAQSLRLGAVAGELVDGGEPARARRPFASAMIWCRWASAASSSIRDLLARVGDGLAGLVGRVGEPGLGLGAGPAGGLTVGGRLVVQPPGLGLEQSGASAVASRPAARPGCAARRPPAGRAAAAGQPPCRGSSLRPWPPRVLRVRLVRLWVDRLHSVHQVLVRRPRPPQASYLVGVAYPRSILPRPPDVASPRARTGPYGYTWGVGPARTGAPSRRRRAQPAAASTAARPDDRPRRSQREDDVPRRRAGTHRARRQMPTATEPATASRPTTLAARPRAPHARPPSRKDGASTMPGLMNSSSPGTTASVQQPAATRTPRGIHHAHPQAEDGREADDRSTSRPAELRIGGDQAHPDTGQHAPRRPERETRRGATGQPGHQTTGRQTNRGPPSRSGRSPRRG